MLPSETMYPYTAKEARERGELELWRANFRANCVLHAEIPGVKIIVGGAVLTPEYAKQIGADYYAKDAKQSADIAKSFFSVG